MLVQLDRMKKEYDGFSLELNMDCLLYTSPSPRD